MALRYVYNDGLIAEGERTFFLANGKMYVRTGVIDFDDTQVRYRLREVYDDNIPQSTNHAPVAADVTVTTEV